MKIQSDVANSKSMPIGIAVFGSTNKKFTQQVIALRKHLLIRNYYKTEGDQIFTVPHLTLCINKDFDIQAAEETKKKIEILIKDQRKLAIPIKEFIVMQNNIAASFDNTCTQELAKKIAGPLLNLGFELVITDHMRIIRSEIKQEFLEEVKNIVDKQLPKQITIQAISMAGRLLRQEDIIWSIPLLHVKSD